MTNEFDGFVIFRPGYGTGTIINGEAHIKGIKPFIIDKKHLILGSQIGANPHSVIYVENVSKKNQLMANYRNQVKRNNKEREKTKEINDELSAADQYFDNGDYAAALEKYIIIYSRHGDHHVLTKINKTAQLVPNTYEILINLIATSKIKLKRYESILTSLANHNERDKNYEAVLIYYVLMYYQSNDSNTLKKIVDTAQNVSCFDNNLFKLMTNTQLRHSRINNLK